MSRYSRRFGRRGRPTWLPRHEGQHRLAPNGPDNSSPETAGSATPVRVFDEYLDSMPGLAPDAEATGGHLLPGDGPMHRQAQLLLA